MYQKKRFMTFWKRERRFRSLDRWDEAVEPIQPLVELLLVQDDE
jgi:hypothetical protein